MGFFYEIWHSEAEPDWQRIMVRSNEVERITDEDLDIFRHTMPDEFFRQEFFCEFLDLEGSLFGYDNIQAALQAGEEVDALQIGDDEW
jgi:hypothetical protein